MHICHLGDTGGGPTGACGKGPEVSSLPILGAVLLSRGVAITVAPADPLAEVRTPSCHPPPPSRGSPRAAVSCKASGLVQVPEFGQESMGVPFSESYPPSPMHGDCSLLAGKGLRANREVHWAHGSSSLLSVPAAGLKGGGEVRGQLQGRGRCVEPSIYPACKALVTSG